MAADAIVHVIDDDEAVRQSLEFLLRAAGVTTRTYESASAFLNALPTIETGCVITDVRMPGLSGLDLQRELTTRGIRLPIIMMSGFSEVPMAVRAMRDGAIDFLEKPFDGQTLVERVRAALETATREYREREEHAAVTASLAKLTPRQRTVLDGLIAGKPSKVIAAELGVSPRTVDVHRFRLMHQLGAQSLPDLFRRVLLIRGEPRS